MTRRLATIWRHPIKSHGRESIGHCDVSAGRTLPWDRVWAVAHDNSTADGSEWVPCANFARGAKAPSLMAIEARTNEAEGTLTLTHPDLGESTIDPDVEADSDALVHWILPVSPRDRALPARIVRARAQGMTDTPYPSISLIGTASLAALSERVGTMLDPRRFRANFWIEGLAPFEEFDWIGRDIKIGAVPFRVDERITRCLATAANPMTGLRDADTLGALETNWGHRDFGVYLTALGDGRVSVGDSLDL